LEGDKGNSKMERLEKLKLAYCLNKNNEEILRDFLCSLEQSLKKFVFKKKFDISPLERDEIIQLTLLKILEHIDNIQNIIAYSQVAIKNFYLQRVIKRREKTLFIEEGNFDIEESSSDQFHDKVKLLPTKLEKELRNIIENMPPPNNEVLKARYFGASHKEIAEKLDVPVNHVGMYITRAEKRLMRKLKNENRKFYEKLADHFGKEV